MVMAGPPGSSRSHGTHHPGGGLQGSRGSGSPIGIGPWAQPSRRHGGGTRCPPLPQEAAQECRKLRNKEFAQEPTCDGEQEGCWVGVSKW